MCVTWAAPSREAPVGLGALMEGVRASGAVPTSVRVTSVRFPYASYAYVLVRLIGSDAEAPVVTT